MTGQGLRERKKALTRNLIANTAARLFAEHGFEHVTVSDVAREADVAEQTVYNYFPTKDQLVTDRDEAVRDRLCELIRTRAATVTPAGAIREFVLGSVAEIGAIPHEVWRGEIGHLAAISPTVHRLLLELSDRQARALAEAITESTVVSPQIATIQGIALAGVFQMVIVEAGTRTRDGRSQPEIADALQKLIEDVIDELDRWFRAGGMPARR